MAPRRLWGERIPNIKLVSKTLMALLTDIVIFSGYMIGSDTRVSETVNQGGFWRAYDILIFDCDHC